MSDNRSAALLLRVWFEDGPEEFRARMTAVGDVPPEEVTVALASSPSEVITAVREWLEEFIRQGGPNR